MKKQRLIYGNDHAEMFDLSKDDPLFTNNAVWINCSILPSTEVRNTAMLRSGMLPGRPGSISDLSICGPEYCQVDLAVLGTSNLTSGVPPLGAVTPDIGQFKSEAKSVAIFKVVHTVKTIWPSSLICTKICVNGQPGKNGNSCKVHLSVSECLCVSLCVVSMCVYVCLSVWRFYVF